jgi:hypothetical protein
MGMLEGFPAIVHEPHRSCDKERDAIRIFFHEGELLLDSPTFTCRLFWFLDTEGRYVVVKRAKHVQCGCFLHSGTEWSPSLSLGKARLHCHEKQTFSGRLSFLIPAGLVLVMQRGNA